MSLSVNGQNPLLNLSPLPARPQADKTTAYEPTDQLVPSPAPQAISASLYKVALLAMSLLAKAGSVAQAQCPAAAPQLQTQENPAAKLLANLGAARRADQSHFFLHIAILGADIEISRDKAADNIMAGREVLMKTVKITNLPTDRKTPVSVAGVQETRLSNLQTLQQLANSEAGNLSGSEVEHLSKGLQAFAAPQGDYLYQMKDVESTPDGQSRVKADDVLSPFEAASHLLHGQSVAFVATPIADLAQAQLEGRSLSSVKGEVELVSDAQDLLNMPGTFDAARDVYHPTMPWAKGAVEHCVTTPQADGSTQFHCESAILRN